MSTERYVKLGQILKLKIFLQIYFDLSSFASQFQSVFYFHLQQLHMPNIALKSDIDYIFFAATHSKIIILLFDFACLLAYSLT